MALVRGEIDSEDSFGYWLVRATYYTSNGTYIDYRDYASGGAGTISNTWAQKGNRITSLPTAAKMRIQLFFYMNSGWVAYDDVTLAKAGIETKYYYAGGQRVAMRIGNGTGSTGVQILLGDHLGSTSIIVNADGSEAGGIRYKPWGEQRSSWGTMPTTFRYTGQRQDSYINLYWYGSRWYDDYLNRWNQPDTIVPESSQGTQAWDRFAYSNNNPVTYNDPSGHDACSTSNYNAPGCGGLNDPAKAVEYYKAQGAYDSAIQSAIDIYGVNTEYISSISYNDRMPTYTNALTNPDRSVEVGYSTLFYNQPFDINKDPHTPGFLAATIAHEEIHAEQIVEGTSSYNLKPSDETWDEYLNSKPTTFEAQVGYMNEYEAYKKIGDSADTYRLSGAEKAWMEQRANDNLALMSPEYQTRAENGWYQMGPAPWEGH